MLRNDRIGCSVWFDPILLVPARIVGLLSKYCTGQFTHIVKKKEFRIYSSIQSLTCSAFHRCNQPRCFDAVSSLP